MGEEAIGGTILIAATFVYLGANLLAWRAGMVLADVVLQNGRDMLVSTMLGCAVISLWPR